MSTHGGVGEKAFVAGAGRNARHEMVGPSVKKERHRVTIAPGFVDNPVNSGTIKVVGPAREQIADVDHERARNRGRRNPRAIDMLDLKAAGAVLKQHGYSAPVGVR